MPRSIPPILLTVLAAACAGNIIPQAAPAPVNLAPLPVQAAPASAGRAVASLADIVGEWDIRSFDGRSIPGPDPSERRHAFVDIFQHGMRFSIGCNFFSMTVGIKGDMLRRTQGASTGTEMGCGPGSGALDQTFTDFLASGPQLSLLPDGRLRMTAPGHDLLLGRASLLAVSPSLIEDLAKRDTAS